MERSVTPWRVLDAEDALGVAAADTGRSAPSTRGGSPVLLRPILAALAVAAGLGIAAVALVASGPTPVAIVQTDAAPVTAPEGAIGASGSTVPPAPAEIVVHVAGAVGRPGLVRLPAGSRVGDAIDAAGGLGPRVDVARLGTEVNLAAVIGDGERVVVPSRDAPVTGSDGGGAGGASGGTATGASGAAPGSTGQAGPVDLNHASAKELEALPGIGEVTAAKIIEARMEQPFRSVDELLERKVVGSAMLAKFRDLVIVR
jgi:competence protein ComEA